MKNLSLILMFVVGIAIPCLVSGCASAKPVPSATLRSQMSMSKAEAMEVLKEALNNRVYRVEVTEEGFTWKEYFKVLLNQVDTVPVNSGKVVFADVTEIKTAVNFQGGAYVLYGKNGKKCFVSGVIRSYKDPAVLNRIVGAYLVLCPNAK